MERRTFIQGATVGLLGGGALSLTGAATAAPKGNTRTECDSLKAQLAALQAEYDAHMATHQTTPPPPPPPAAIRFGACPAGGGAGTYAQQTITSKYGSDTTMRLFNSGGFTTPTAIGPATHQSWKPVEADVLGGRLDGQIITIANATRSGDYVTIWHETDVKYRKDVKAGLSNAAQLCQNRVAAQNRFYDIVKQANPNAKVSLVLSGWSFQIDDYTRYRAKADVLSVDWDGIPPDANGNYADFLTKSLPTAVQVAKNWGMQLSCAEFGSPRAGNDPDGSRRVEWMKKNVAAFQAAGVRDVLLFDYPESSATDYRLTLSNEVNYWKANAALNA